MSANEQYSMLNYQWNHSDPSDDDIINFPTSPNGYAPDTFLDDLITTSPLPLHADGFSDASLAAFNTSTFFLTDKTLGVPQTGTPVAHEVQEVAVESGGFAEDTSVGFYEATAEEKLACRTIVEVEFGAPYGFCDPKPIAIARIVSIERLFCCLLVSGVIRVRPEDLLQDEMETGVGRFLRPGRCFDVSYPLAFNEAFRALQCQHPDWLPRVNFLTGLRSDPVTTTAVSQLLDALGIGPAKASPWSVHRGGIRGPRETDPRGTSKRQRDGLYYFRYVYDEERAKKECNAKRLFKSVVKTH